IPQQTATAEQLKLAAALFYQHSANQHTQTLARWRNTASVPVTYRLEANGQLHSVSVDDLQLTTDGRHASLVIKGVRRRIAYHLDGNR
ncbi:3-methylcrotonyl-CoA carboxylase, partial [Pseudomonas sp. SIMBA_077]